jgi:beta-phosphoglucomutase-like phosphatase (HAD superfamily)
VFDLDGTLVDTVDTRIAAWLEVFDRYGLPAKRLTAAGLLAQFVLRIGLEAPIESHSESHARCPRQPS